MRRCAITVIESIVFGMIMLVVLVGILWVGRDLISAQLQGGSEPIQITSVKSNLEQMFDVCSYEYDYNTIIAHSKQIFNGVDYGSAKILIKAQGVIKSGCTLKDVQEDNSTWTIVLGAPRIIEDHVISFAIIDDEEWLLNKFPITVDKDVSDKVHEEIKQKIYPEMIDKTLEKTKNLIVSFLLTSNIVEANIKFVVE